MTVLAGGGVLSSSIRIGLLKEVGVELLVPPLLTVAVLAVLTFSLFCSVERV